MNKISWYRGSSCYVFYEDRLISNIEKMEAALETVYPNFRIAYSYKTNYLKKIATTSYGFGCMAEVVSPEEYVYALINDVPKDEIVYNGVIPDHDRKFTALMGGAMVNVDNVTELEQIANRVNKYYDFEAFSTHKIGIGLRVNFEIDNGLVSRFGIDVNGEDFGKALSIINNSSRMYLRGFQCHIGSARDPKFWAKKVRTLAELAKKHDVAYMDIGGGFYGEMPESLSKQFPGHPGEVFGTYATIIGEQMNEVFPDQDTMLIVEPGTALVGNTMDVMAYVTDIKKVRGQTYITVDTNSNSLGVIVDIKDIPMEVEPMANDRVEVKDAIVAGNTCLEYDYLKKGFSGTIGIGDRVWFRNVGAYSISSSRQFIRPRMAVVDYHNGIVIKPPETYEDMFEIG